MKKLENENKTFVKKWEIYHIKGFAYYLITKTATLGIMMLCIYLINILVNKETNYLLSGIIYVLITIIAPILSWFFNERRYQKYE